MQVFCKNGLVICSHADNQLIDPSVYGEGVRIISAPRTYKRDDPEPEPTPELLTTYAASKRWLTETSGFEAQPGWFVNSGTQAQAKLSLAIQQGADVDWKGLDGTFRHLKKADLTNLSHDLAVFIQDCFTKESQCVAGISGGTIHTFDDIDAVFGPTRSSKNRA
jgi:hypothetical protein